MTIIYVYMYMLVYICLWTYVPVLDYASLIINIHIMLSKYISKIFNKYFVQLPLYDHPSLLSPFKCLCYICTNTLVNIVMWACTTGAQNIFGSIRGSQKTFAFKGWHAYFTISKYFPPPPSPIRNYRPLSNRLFTML